MENIYVKVSQTIVRFSICEIKCPVTAHKTRGNAKIYIFRQHIWNTTQFFSYIQSKSNNTVCCGETTQSLPVLMTTPNWPQFSFSFFSVLHLSIDDKYQSPSSSEDHLVVEGGVEEVNLAWEVPNLEVDEWAAGDVVLVDLVGALQEQGLIGRHFVEHHLKNESWVNL